MTEYELEQTVIYSHKFINLHSRTNAQRIWQFSACRTLVVGELQNIHTIVIIVVVNVTATEFHWIVLHIQIYCIKL